VPIDDSQLPTPLAPSDPEELAAPAERFGLRRTFAALAYPNYRRWFAGQLVSLFGSWTQASTQGFLVYELTRSPAYLGYVSFAGGVPAWLFTLFGGVLADRVPRRRLLLGTQSALMILAWVLAALTFLGVIRAWHIIAIAFLHGVVNAFDAPARQAFIVEMVDRPDITNAIALNSTIFHSATTVGPAIAGVLYAAIGPAWCFAINALSFLAVLAALASMRVTPAPRGGRGSALTELREGLRFVARHPTIRPLIAGLGAVSCFGLGMMTLTPAWAVRVLHGHARTNGLLLSARGLGSLASALTIASLGRITYRGRLLALGQLLLPAGMLVFAAMRGIPAALASLVGVGFVVIAIFNMTNALVQSATPDELRGRVMSIYTMTFFGLMPLGALLAGSLAAQWGEPTAVVCLALTLLLAAVVYWLRLGRLRALQ
jgi:MFS family permease